jgi:hypothetical protein
MDFGLWLVCPVFVLRITNKIKKKENNFIMADGLVMYYTVHAKAYRFLYHVFLAVDSIGFEPKRQALFSFS